MLPPGGGYLMVEFGAETADEARGRAAELARAIRAASRFARPASCSAMSASSRRCGSCANPVSAPARSSRAVRAPGRAPRTPPWRPRNWAASCAGSPPCSTASSGSGNLLRAFRRRMRPLPDQLRLFQPRGRARSFKSAMIGIADLVGEFGGSLSGEHGDGRARSELLPKIFGPELIEAFAEFKRVFDPDSRMNPGVIVAARRDLDAICAPPRGAPSRDPLRFQRRRRLCRRRPAMRRDRQVPPSRRRDDVPVVHGDARGSPFHARPGASAVRSPDRRFSQRRRRRRRCPRRAGLVPGVQGLQARMPGQRRHGDLQSGVPVALLPSPSPAAVRSSVRQDPSSRESGAIRAGPGQPDGAIAAVKAPASAICSESIPTARCPHLPRSHSAPGSTSGKRAARHERGVVLFPDTFTNFFEPQIARAAVEVLERAGFQVEIPPSTCVAGGRCSTRGCSIRQTAGSARVMATCWVRCATRARQSSVWSPVACSPFATNCRICFPRDPRAAKAGAVVAAARRVPGARGAGPSPTRAARARIAAWPLPSEGNGRAGQRNRDPEADFRTCNCRFRTRDAAGWRARSDTTRTTSKSRAQSASGYCCRRSAPRTRNTIIISDGFSCRSQIAQLCPGRHAMHLAEVLNLG